MLAYLIVALFLSLLFLNFYFKKEILKHYRVLYQNRVEFTFAQLFDRSRLEREVLSRYPGQRSDIVAFADKIRRSAILASVLLLGIMALAWIIKLIN